MLPRAIFSPIFLPPTSSGQDLKDLQVFLNLPSQKGRLFGHYHTRSSCVKFVSPLSPHPCLVQDRKLCATRLPESTIHVNSNVNVNLGGQVPSAQRYMVSPLDFMSPIYAPSLILCSDIAYCHSPPQNCNLCNSRPFSEYWKNTKEN